MQHAKDTFYITLRDRIAALNPARTVLVRGVSRPAVMVEENELPSVSEQPGVFRVRWASLNVDPRQTQPLAAMQCEIRYATAGNSANGGMDRGRLLAAMDAELATALNSAPQRAPKLNYTGNGSTAMQTNIFWNNVIFNPAETKDDQLQRIVTVEVFSHQEAGEL